MTRLAACLVVAGLAGCYAPGFDRCQVQCAADRSCPGDLQCNPADDHCHADLAEPVCTPGDADAGGDGPLLDGGGGDAPGTDGPPAVSWTALAASYDTACAIDTANELWCWGRNDHGQLGVDTADVPRAARATRVGTAVDWEQVTVGEGHVCGVRTGGLLFCWGANGAGQIGNGTVNDSAPVLAPFQVSGTWLSVSAGWAHTCAVRGDHRLFCWGADYDGQLGAGGDPTVLDSPTEVLGPDGGASVADWEAVSAGADHSCGLRAGGVLFCWGRNASGKLGLGQDDVAPRNVPTPVDTTVAASWQQVAAGVLHTCGLATGGTLACWGYNSDGQVSGFEVEAHVPFAVSGDVFDAVAVGGFTSCGLRAGQVLCWGDNDTGQVSPDPAGAVAVPTVGGGLDAGVEALAVGWGFVCGRLAGGSLRCRGVNGDGQLGEGAFADKWVPARVGDGVTWDAVSAGIDHVCARDAAGVSCWGRNDRGQLGTGDRVQRLQPAPLATVAGADVWGRVGTGELHSCALADGGELWCWGANDVGQRGGGGSTHVDEPTRIGTVSDFGQLATGANGNCAYRGDGVRWCWGDSSIGQLGAGDATYVSTPTVMTSLPTDGWTVGSQGKHHGCGISAGELWCWGGNDYGQIGVAPGGPVLAPSRVGSRATWTQVAASAEVGHTCGIDAGELYCWGRDHSGQLGVPAVTDMTSMPQVVDLGGSVDSLCAGSEYTCAIDTSHALRCWGWNEDGQLGDGSLLPRDVPGAALDGTWSQVSCGPRHVCGVQTDGTLWCWGENVWGVIGDGTGARREAVPVVR